MERYRYIWNHSFNLQYEVFPNLKPSERILVMWDNGSIELLEQQEKFRDNWNQARNQLVVAFMIIDISAAKNL